MKHILFPTVAAADAFIADLQSRGAVKPEIGTTTFNRRSAGPVGTTVPSTSTDYDAAGGMNGGTAEDAGAGAVKGTVAGVLSGAAIGAIGTATGLIGATAATVATGGLALPVILGMAALGSGVGAAVGAAGGAAGIDETGEGTHHAGSELDDDAYNRIDTGVSAGGRAVAVDEHVDPAVLEEAMRAHDGHFV
ncbi:hypothetical protein [Deinococcus sp.]|uniref:hypothetical protein n=1 Tax=Deinococcus sp. TaxID=47478 RepID=UPI003C7A16BD